MNNIEVTVINSGWGVYKGIKTVRVIDTYINHSGRPEATVMDDEWYATVLVAKFIGDKWVIDLDRG